MHTSLRFVKSALRKTLWQTHFLICSFHSHLTRLTTFSHLVLTGFSLAFKELAKLLREDITMAGILAETEKDMIDGYIVSRYCVVAVRKEVTRSSRLQKRR